MRDGLIQDAAKAVLDAYWQRFAIGTGNYMGPIDEEIRTLEAALEDSKAGQAVQAPTNNEGLLLDVQHFVSFLCGATAFDGKHFGERDHNGAFWWRTPLRSLEKEIIKALYATPASAGTAREDAADCAMPPPGWRCTSGPGHEGPCAAVAIGEGTTKEWCANHPASAAWLINNLAKRFDDSPTVGPSLQAGDIPKSLMQEMVGEGWTVVSHGEELPHGFATAYSLEKVKKAVDDVQKVLQASEPEEVYHLRRNAAPKVRRVVCAAIRAADGSVLLGIRHYSRDMHDQIAARHDGEKFKHRYDQDQGFVDQNGIFMSRYEAFQVASEAGQISNLSACGAGIDEGLVSDKLYSEGLY